MTYGSAPAAPAPPAKKGLGPLAWILIGCGGLIVLLGILFFAGVGFLGYKAKQFAENAESKPVETLAKVVAMTNPEIAFVSADEEAKKATFRNEKTGETLTISLEDMQAGKISFETDKGKVEFNAQGGENGQFQVTTEDGKVIKAGVSDADNRPDWVPVYPGSSVQGGVAASGSEGEGGLFSLTTDASVADVFDYYKKQLQAAGFNLNEQTFSANGVETRTLVANRDSDGHGLTVVITSQDGKTQASLQYAASEK